MKKRIDKLKDFYNNYIKYNDEQEYSFSLDEKANEIESINSAENTEEYNDFKKHEQLKQANIFDSLNVNIDYIKNFYTYDLSTDVVIREFIVNANNKSYPACLVYIEGMVNTQLINEYILKSLMLKNKSNTNTNEEITRKVTINNVAVRKVKKFNLEDHIFTCLIPQNNMKKQNKFSEILSDINSGNCMLFIDTLNCAFSLEVKGFQFRQVSAPQNEVVIRGAQEAFVEVLRVNTSLIRRIVNNEDLVIESVTIGNLSKTSCAICYIKSIANDTLINEVKHRLKNINVDYLISAGQLEQLIEDKNLLSAPQLLATERPDKATLHLLDGRVVVLVNGSPYALVMPATLMDLLSSPEDSNLKFQYANLLKLIRLFACFFALLLPGVYVAITNFHHELIPTELLFAIATSRETVPFPTLFEILIMELSFELIREAGIRVPSPIGPTIGIVGALILGQAAVSANLVSPILIIVVAITGISSFAVPDFSLGFYIRLLRFLYIALGYLAGFLGIATGIFVHTTILASIKSFGVPFLSPYAPKIFSNNITKYFISPIWKREKRPDFLNTKREKLEPKISMQWKKTGGKYE